MPYSSLEGKESVRLWLRYVQPKSVLDIGAGAGMYSRIVRQECPDAVLDAVEIFEPYVSMFKLHEKYDRIVIGDARDVNLPKRLPLERYDVIIMGDVLEHMTHDEAQTLWCSMLPLSKRACIGSLPIVPYPQGPEHGNAHEAHVSEWDPGLVLSTFPLLSEWYFGEEIGTFIAHTQGLSTFPLPVGVAP